MTKRNITKIFLMLILLLLTIATATATDISDNTTTDNQDIMQEIPTITDSSNDIETIENKIIKEDKTVKKEAYTATVNNYNELKTKINEAKKSNYDNYTINLNNGTYTLTDTSLVWGKTSGTKTLIINGNNQTIDGQNKYAFLNITNGYNLIINNTIFKNHNSSDSSWGFSFLKKNGGAIKNEGSLTIANSTFLDNKSNQHGGAIYSKGTVQIINTTFKNNKATNGAAIYFDGDISNINITNSTFTDNNATTDGGAINFAKTVNNLTLEKNIFTNNSASYGGAINFHGTQSNPEIIKNNKFYNNTAKKGGALAYFSKTTENIQYVSNIFDGNTATEDGGAIYYDITTNNLTLNKNTFRNNKASSNRGGAIVFIQTPTNNTFTQNTFTNNTAKYGGVMTIDANSYNITFTKNTFTNNTATATGGVLNQYPQSTDMYFKENTFTNNSVTGIGGALYYDQGCINTQVINNTFTSNTATENGGAICGNKMNITISKSVFTNNSANYGGAIFTNQSNSTILNNNFTNNLANIECGAIYGPNSTTVINNSKFRYTLSDHEDGVYIKCDNINSYNSTLEQDITNFTLLHSVLTSNPIDNIIINIKSNLNLTSNTELNNKIKTLTINGNAKTINGTGQNQFLKINETNTKINNIKVVNCYASEGGAIYTNGDLTITKCNLSYNNAAIGGAIRTVNSTVLLDNSIFMNNYAYTHGGVIRTDYCNITIKNSTLNNNNVDRSNGGGVINAEYTNLTIINSTLNNNTAPEGGALRNVLQSKVTITNSTFNNNTVTNRGSAIKNDESNTTINNCTFNNNTASAGCVDNGNSNVSIVQSTFYNNNARYGGAVSNHDKSNLTITSCIFNNNSASEHGGAIQIDDGRITIKKSIFTNNTAGYYGGGAIRSNGNEYSLISNNTFEKNNAKKGSAIYYTNNENYSSISNNIFIKNKAEENNYETAIVTDGTNNTISNNTNYSITVYKNSIKIDGNKYIIKNNKFLDNINTIYVNSKGTGTGKTTKDPTNITHALEIVEDNDIIKLVSSTKTDTYSKNILINKNTTNATTFSIIGEENKNVIVSNRITIDDIVLTIKNIVFKGKNSGITSYKLKLTNCTFENNSAENGGAILVKGTSIIANSTFIQNNATSGGAIYIDADGVNIINNTFQSNNANSGGAIYNTGSYVSIKNNTFYANNAEVNGGAIYNKGAHVVVQKNLFNKNSAKNASAIYLEGNQHTERSPYQKDEGYWDYGNIRIANYVGGSFVGYTYPNKKWISVIKTYYNYYTVKTGNDINITENIFKHNKAEGQNPPITISNYAFESINNTNEEISYQNSTVYGSAPEVKIINNTFNDTKVTTKLSVSTNNTKPYINNTVKFTFTLKDETNNVLPSEKIIATINNKNYTLTTNANGQATQTYTPTTSGKQTIIAKYDGNTLYNSSSASTSITVNKLNTKLTIKSSATSVQVGKNVTFTATLTDQNNNKLSGQNIIFTIDNKNYTVKTNSNGTATQTYTTSKIANLTVTAKYTATTYYNANSSSVKVTVNGKINTKLTVNSSATTPVVNDTITITATLTDKDNKKLANQNVVINIENKNYTVKTDSNGQATQKHKVTKVATCTVTAKYNGDNTYNISSATTKITVRNKTGTNSKVNTKLALKVSNSTPIVNNQITINATLTDTANNKLVNQSIVLTVNNKNYTLKTDKNGIITQTYKPTATGTQTITAKYNGNSIYNSSSASTKITVKAKINTKLTLKSSNTNPETNTNITITATLTDASNNKLASQTVVLNINNKNYTLKTDKNGVITQTYKPTATGTQTITAKYNGNSIYNANNTSLKITVKQQIIPIAGYIYVSSNGKGNGKTVNTPTNMTYALSIVKNNQVIMMVTNSTSDTYKNNITLKINDTVNNNTSTFSIIGQNGKQIILNGKLEINKNLNVTVKNLIFKKNATIVSIDSSLTVDNCTFTNIQSSTGGILIQSNIKNDSNVRSIINSKFINVSSTNTDYTYGAISTDANNTLIKNNTFQKNNSPSSGGAIIILSDKNNITNNTFNNNSARYNGGAVLISGNNNTVTKNTFINNQAPNGGALCNNGDKNIITNNTFKNNNASTHGGAISNLGYYNDYSNNTYSNNHAQDEGGAIYNEGFNSRIANSTFNNNNAPEGGALYNYEDYTLIQQNNFNQNNASDNGGAVYNKGKNIRVINNTFTKNKAENGAAIYNQKASMNITGNTFNNNAAQEEGGAIYNTEDYFQYTTTSYDAYRRPISTVYKESKVGNINVTNNQFINNTAEKGGAIYDYLNERRGLPSEDEKVVPVTDKIINNSFIGNKAEDATVLYSNMIELTFNKNLLLNNTLTTEQYTQKILVGKNDSFELNSRIENILWMQENTNITLTYDDSVGSIINSYIASKNAFLKDNPDAELLSITYQEGFEVTIANNSNLDSHNNTIYHGDNNTLLYNNVTVNLISNADLRDGYMENNTLISKKALESSITITSNNTKPRVLDTVKLTLTLKDGNSKVLKNQNITVTVNNKSSIVNTNSKGQAIINYTMTKKDKLINITANYNGNITQEAAKKNLTINRYYKADMELLTGSFDSKPGDTVKLIAHITDNGMDIDGGQLVFKLNAVSLKDDKGNAIKVKISKGLAILEYKIPDTLGARTHNLTAVYASGNYGRVELSTPMTINKYYTHIDVNPLYTTTNTVTVKAQVVDQNNQALNKQTLICIKVNGKSYTFNTTTGTINYKISQTFKDGYHNITIISGENGKYLSSTVKTIMLKNKTIPKTNYINNTLNTKSTQSSGDLKTGKIMSILTGSSTVKSGDRLKLIAHLSEDDVDITGGQLVFKLNSVTLKDENNSVVKVNIKNGLGILDYKIPDTLGARTHNLTAVYSSNKYGRIEQSASLTMNRLNTHIESEPMYTNSSTTYIKARILDDNNQLINKKTAVVIKIDGKSYSFNTTTGTINYKVPVTLSKGLHQITIIAGENGKYISSRVNTVLIKT